MRTGATKEQLDRAKKPWFQSNAEYACALVSENHRIIAVDDLLLAWERITSQANLSDEDAALANRLHASIGHDPRHAPETGESNE